MLADLNGDIPDGQFGFDWRLIAQPADSGATLEDARSAKPVFTPGLEGSYQLSVTVHFQPDTAPATGSTSDQSVMVSARPDDPPIGVPIETLAGDPPSAIEINGNPVNNPEAVFGLHFAVLDRTTRAVVDFGDVPRDDSGVAQLVGIATKFSGKLGYFMIVSGLGVAPGALNRLVDLERILGHDLNADERRRVTTGVLGSAFSIIGIPGAASNSAWSDVGYPGNLTEAKASGDIAGSLQVNTATNLYDFVTPEYPNFATAAPGSSATTDVIQVGSQSYSATLPAGATAGIHLLALDPYSLLPVQASDPTFANNQIWPTNTNAGTAADIRDQTKLGFAISNLGQGLYPGSLIILQTVGAVRVLEGSLGRRVYELGGNQALFNTLAAPGSYALVGRAISLQATAPIVPPVAESSTSLGQSGQLTGVLARSRNDFSFAPLVSDSPDAAGTMNTGLISVAYQPPQPFPAFTGGQAAAETYIGDQLRLCEVDAVSCDVRKAYYQHYQADWHQKALDLARMGYPGSEDFTAADFNAVKNQLGDEISDLNQVQTYLAALQRPFERSGTRAYVDLQAIGQQIQDALNRPGGNAGPSGLALIAFFVNATKIFFDTIGQRPYKLFLDAIGAGLSLIAASTRPDGSPTLDGAIKATTSQLASAILDRFDAAQRALTTVGLLIVSDYGKLQTTANHVDSDWRLPPDSSAAVNALQVATQRFYYQTLVPIAYPRMIQIEPPPPTGPSNARRLFCKENSGGLVGTQFYDEPDVAQDQQTFGFTGSGAPISSVVFLRGPGKFWYGMAPSEQILTRLFAPAGPGLPGLGFNKKQFYSSSSPSGVTYANPNLNWGRRLVAQNLRGKGFDDPPRCGLPDRS